MARIIKAKARGNCSYADTVMLAASVHQGHFRKFSKDPYIVHLLRVSELISLRFKDHPRADFMRMIALLHDVIEDTWVDASTLTERFGDEVADAVSALTRSSTGKPREDNERYAAQIRGASDEVKMVKLADIYDNVHDWPDNPEFAEYAEKVRLILEDFRIGDKQYSAAFVELKEQVFSEMSRKAAVMSRDEQ